MADDLKESIEETPELTIDQQKRGCRIDNGKVLCPPSPERRPLVDGNTEIIVGQQKIRSVRCMENRRKPGTLDCTVVSESKQ